MPLGLVVAKPPAHQGCETSLLFPCYLPMNPAWCQSAAPSASPTWVCGTMEGKSWDRTRRGAHLEQLEGWRLFVWLLCFQKVLEEGASIVPSQLCQCPFVHWGTNSSIPKWTPPAGQRTCTLRAPVSLHWHLHFPSPAQPLLQTDRICLMSPQTHAKPQNPRKERSLGIIPRFCSCGEIQTSSFLCSCTKCFTDKAVTV